MNLTCLIPLDLVCDMTRIADGELVGVALFARRLHDDPGMGCDASAGVATAAASDVIC